MNDFQLNTEQLKSEFILQASRSSGPGGQNVNKVNSKIELRFNIQDSKALTDEQKSVILSKLATRINSEGFLVVVSQRNRSQLDNKDDAIMKTIMLIAKALQPIKPRKSTRPTKSSIEKRLTGKKIVAEKKQNRQKIDE